MQLKVISMERIKQHLREKKGVLPISKYLDEYWAASRMFPELEDAYYAEYSKSVIKEKKKKSNSSGANQVMWRKNSISLNDFIKECHSFAPCKIYVQAIAKLMDVDEVFKELKTYLSGWGLYKYHRYFDTLGCVLTEVNDQRVKSPTLQKVFEDERFHQLRKKYLAWFNTQQEKRELKFYLKEYSKVHTKESLKEEIDRHLNDPELKRRRCTA